MVRGAAAPHIAGADIQRSRAVTPDERTLLQRFLTDRAHARAGTMAAAGDVLFQGLENVFSRRW